MMDQVFTPTVGNVTIWKTDKEQLTGADIVDGKASVVRIGSAAPRSKMTDFFLIEEKIDICIPTDAIIRHLERMGWEVN